MQGLWIAAGAVAGSVAAYLLARKGMALAVTKPALVQRALGTSQLASFPWGTDSFVFKLLPHCLLFGAGSTAAAIAATTPSGPITSLDMARGPVLVTLLWIWGYFNHISNQIKVKMGGGNEQAKRITERTLYNTIEQGIPFLTLLWLTAACVDAAVASSCGLIYAALRMCYGLTYSYYGGFSMLAELVTMPNYTTINLYAASLLHFGLTGASPFTHYGSSFLFWFPVVLVGHVLMMGVVWDYPVGKAASQVNLAWNKEG